MIYSAWDDLLINYPTLQKILFIIIVVGSISVVLYKFELFNPKIFILCLSAIMVYLYAVNVVSSTVFTITLLILFITLFIMFKMGGKNEIN